MDDSRFTRHSFWDILMPIRNVSDTLFSINIHPPLFCLFYNGQESLFRLVLGVSVISVLTEKGEHGIQYPLVFKFLQSLYSLLANFLVSVLECIQQGINGSDVPRLTQFFHSLFPNPGRWIFYHLDKRSSPPLSALVLLSINGK